MTDPTGESSMTRLSRRRLKNSIRIHRTRSSRRLMWRTICSTRTYGCLLGSGPYAIFFFQCLYWWIERCPFVLGNPAGSSLHPINPTVAPLVGFAPSTPAHNRPGWFYIGDPFDPHPTYPACGLLWVHLDTALGISGIFRPDNEMDSAFWAQARMRSFP
jgi:hypothetical protein